MQLYKYPDPKIWFSLCQRPAHQASHVEQQVAAIMQAVRMQGDKALRQFNRQFDGYTGRSLRVSPSEYAAAEKHITPKLKKALEIARDNIWRFHAAQKEKEKKITTSPGVVCWRKSVAIEKVGLYVPGGSAPLFSSLLMLGIPARIAGCRQIVVCTPPGKDGTIAPEILYVARMLQITTLYKVGGAQAIAAMTYGTGTIAPVDKIFGPGNLYVTTAKMLAQKEGVAIDMPAGPSEVLIIADHTAQPAFVAADLLSQAEHGADSQVLLVSDNGTTISRVMREVRTQLNRLPRKKIAEKALNNSKAILVRNLKEAVAFSNAYAPEHLILAVAQPGELAEQVTHAGSVFLGHYSCESAGDYASGTNHTLPTQGFARSYSGVSLDSFVRKITFQEISQAGLANLGPAIEQMAAAEKLIAHKQAVTVRLQTLTKQNPQPAFLWTVRNHLLHVRPYSSARDEFSGTNKIFLDANENPFPSSYNRYPDPHQRLLKERISKIKRIPVENIFLGNGSDEAIDLLIRVFCQPGEDHIIVCPPTYGMYEVAANVHQVDVVKVPLLKNFQPDRTRLQQMLQTSGLKLIFLCSPNNPTGNLIHKDTVKALCTQFRNGLIVLDEAYIDFCPSGSLLRSLQQYPNLIILQTLSKAWGLAGIRLGMAFAHKDIIALLDKVKPPYNISAPTQQIALERLSDVQQKNQNVMILSREREKLRKALQSLKTVERVYPSDANFLLVRFARPKEVYQYLLRNGIVVRDRTSAVAGCLRITVGTPEENQFLIKLLRDKY
ncbi:MAG: hypothetical protein KatS3mg031_0212 [Chitinophagales bacterium]|nr:MAG: hypothetical protein KatS3mg031_0212 [Chitinophagales bacterium]